MKEDMATVERRKQILTLLSENEQVYVNELSTRFNVTEVTIRNDLKRLQKQDLLIRFRGGASLSRNMRCRDKQISEKHRLTLQRNEKIGRLASTLIKEQNTIILDSGKSTCVLGRNLRRFKELTVITNDLNIAYEMIQFSNISLNMLGCNISRKSLTLVGTIAEQSLKKFYVDRLFLCVDGIDSGTGLYALNIDEADLKKMMLGASQQVILMADSSQFNRKSFAYICDMDRIHMIVTDGGIPKTDRQIFTNAGIELLISE